MSTEVPDVIERVYFIGIAGIGMSALARYFRSLGVSVSGYDIDRSSVAKSLEEEGIVVHYAEEESILPEAPDLVVYTPAIPDTHKGLQHYRNIGVPVMKRSQILGWISSRHKCIAVAGTHGKTTTSAMITWVMRNCGVNATAFLGGLAPDLGGNFVQGDSEWLIAEADEYDRSFHTLSPAIAVATAMDADHLDVYGNYEEMVESYIGFLQKVHQGGTIILHEEVKKRLGQKVLDGFMDRDIKVITYGIDSGDYRISELRREGKGVRFVLRGIDGVRRVVVIGMPGLHNALNATVALAICDVLRLELPIAIRALAKFSGIKRRFEVVYADERHTIIDDYAHHPEELSAAISAARLQYPGKSLPAGRAGITGVFQPHLYSRTRDFYREFAKSLDALDTCILVELYPARELPIEGVSSKLIFDQIKNRKKHLTTKKQLISLLVSLNPEILLLLGAGDLDRMVPEMIERLKVL
ncbi:MAG TPA: UDP-N-acetylmuramate--L-alanine ligase [Saprospiraceae bacterium]|nr:UDP-N-acetylmuramate--L-alanine ligase [Saprospiraceae bacterium]